jgi:hypothetical protein
MSALFDVLVAGSYSVDLIFSGMPELPQLGKDLLSTGFMMTPGEAFISAVCMHRLGLKVGWAGDFGNDDFSQFALTRAREEGLDESLFVTHDRPYRRISASFSYPDERGFITYYDPDPKLPAVVGSLVKSQARLLYIPGLYYGSFLDTAIKWIRLKKMKLFMDGNSSRGNILGYSSDSKSIRKAIKSVDIFLPNAQEARRLTGIMDLEYAIRELGELCSIVVVKDGRNGSYAYANNALFHVPSIPVDVVDTTGAGDCFNAGFICAWLNGQPLATCLKWGNIIGGLSTTQLGGTTRKISLNELKETLSQCYP